MSPDALEAHPGAIETDPFFSTEYQIARDESIDAANGAAAGMSTSPVVSDGLASAHLMQPTRRSTSAERSAERARGLSASTLMARRFSNLSATGRKPPTRTESGREFWGLPEPVKSQISLSDQDEESEEDEDEEWVSVGSRSR